jgi:serine/threonine-protein kinase RsbW
MEIVRPANIKPVRKPEPGETGASSFCVTVEASMPSEIDAISPLMDQLVRLIEGSCCITGSEFAVELALREALNNAVVHGNAMDPHEFVEVRCCCESGKGLWLSVTDQGNGFDPGAVADPLKRDNLNAEHGRGIYLMNWAMDRVEFESGAPKCACGKALRAREDRSLRTKSSSAGHILTANRRRTALPGVPAQVCRNVAAKNFITA